MRFVILITLCLTLTHGHLIKRNAELITPSDDSGLIDVPFESSGASDPIALIKNDESKVTPFQEGPTKPNIFGETFYAKTSTSLEEPSAKSIATEISLEKTAHKLEDHFETQPEKIAPDSVVQTSSVILVASESIPAKTSVDVSESASVDAVLSVDVEKETLETASAEIPIVKSPDEPIAPNQNSAIVEEPINSPTIQIPALTSNIELQPIIESVPNSAAKSIVNADPTEGASTPDLQIIAKSSKTFDVSQIVPGSEPIAIPNAEQEANSPPSVSEFIKPINESAQSILIAQNDKSVIKPIAKTISEPVSNSPISETTNVDSNEKAFETYSLIGRSDLINKNEVISIVEPIGNLDAISVELPLEVNNAKSTPIESTTAEQPESSVASVNDAFAGVTSANIVSVVNETKEAENSNEAKLISFSDPQPESNVSVNVNEKSAEEVSIVDSVSSIKKTNLEDIPSTSSFDLIAKPAEPDLVKSTISLASNIQETAAATVELGKSVKTDSLDFKLSASASKGVEPIVSESFNVESSTASLYNDDKAFVPEVLEAKSSVFESSQEHPIVSETPSISAEISKAAAPIDPPTQEVAPKLSSISETASIEPVNVENSDAKPSDSKSFAASEFTEKEPISIQSIDSSVKSSVITSDLGATIETPAKIANLDPFTINSEAIESIKVDSAKSIESIEIPSAVAGAIVVAPSSSSLSSPKIVSISSSVSSPTPEVAAEIVQPIITVNHPESIALESFASNKPVIEVNPSSIDFEPEVLNTPNTDSFRPSSVSSSHSSDSINLASPSSSDIALQSSNVISQPEMSPASSASAPASSSIVSSDPISPAAPSSPISISSPVSSSSSAAPTTSILPLPTIRSIPTLFSSFRTTKPTLIRVVFLNPNGRRSPNSSSGRKGRSEKEEPTVSSDD